MRFDVKNINVIIQAKKKNMLPSHSLMSHSNIPSWQRLKTCRHINRLTHIRSQKLLLKIVTYGTRDDCPTIPHSCFCLASKNGLI